MRLPLLIIALAAASVVAASPPTARAGSSNCPAASFLQYGGVVYASEKIPAGARVVAGASLGEAEVDQPRSGDDPCKRERRTVEVLEIVGVDSRIAVLAKGGEGFGFIIGGRCTGIARSERWACVLEPLVLGGVPYTAVSYPSEPGARRNVELGAEVGPATLGGADVTARAIAGVDPALALGLPDRPSEVFVAPGVCPYERFANAPELDDLGECLTGPVWFTIAPLGGKPGERITATADRQVPVELDGAAVSLLRLDVAADVLPAQPGERTPVGALDVAGDGTRVELAFAIPDIREGLYELVVACEGCAPEHAGRTLFPAGSFLVLGEATASSGPSAAKIAYVVVFGLLMLGIVGAFVLWRRGYRPGGRRRRSA